MHIGALHPGAEWDRSHRAALGKDGIDVQEPEMVFPVVSRLGMAHRKFGNNFVA